MSICSCHFSPVTCIYNVRVSVLVRHDDIAGLLPYLQPLRTQLPANIMQIFLEAVKYIAGSFCNVVDLCQMETNSPYKGILI